MQVHSVIRWCFERQPRWAREKVGETPPADLVAADSKDEGVPQAPRPCRTLTNDGLFVVAAPSTLASATGDVDRPSAPHLVPPTYADAVKRRMGPARSTGPAPPLAAGLANRPRWMLTPTLLGLDDWRLISTYEQHFDNLGDLLFGELEAGLPASFFVQAKVVGDQGEAERLAEALWGPHAPCAAYFSARARRRPADVAREVDGACRAAGVHLDAETVTFVANLMRLHGLEMDRRQMHHSIVRQAQESALRVSTTFNAEARAAATELLTNHQLAAQRGRFLAAEGAPVEPSLAASLGPDEALDEFAKLLENFQYYRFRERIPPSERTEQSGRTPQTFYLPTTPYGEHGRDALLREEDAVAPDALSPPRYDRVASRWAAESGRGPS